MAKGSAAEKPRQTRPAGRIGRPPQKLAGEVEGRILHAARQVFLERGLAGASIDEIASLARAGKPTVYARFSNKEALFAAVVLSNVAAAAERVEAELPGGATIDQRLVGLGTTLLQWCLSGDTIDLMRVSVAEARRFPDLANSVHRMARERGEEMLARLLAETAQADGLAALPAFAPEHLTMTTRFFMDLVLFPFVKRALFGEKHAVLRAEIEPHVAQSIKFFLAACRHGGVT
jgi:AcrR family transcriptional regulator